MSTTTHPVAPEEVMAFLDGEISAEKSISIAAHLESCSECKEFASQVKTTSQALAQWKTDVPTDSLQERMMEALEGGQSRRVDGSAWLRSFQLFFSRPLPWVLACLAMVILIVGQLNTFNFARRSISVNKAERSRSVLLTNPPAPSRTYSADDAKAGGGGGTSGATFEERENFEERYWSRGVSAPPGARPQTQVRETTKLAPSLPGPLIARVASLSIYVKDFDAGRASLDAILARHNGYAANLSVSSPQAAGRSLQASLRIPAPQLAATLSELKALGRVEAESQNGEEVTQQHADLVARLKNSRETEQRLQDVLRTRTGKVKDVLEVEQEIARVRGETERMEAEQKTLEHRVEFATIDLRLSEEYKAQLNPPAPSVWMQLHNAGVNGFRSAFESFLGIVLFLVESAPSIVLWLVILGCPAWLLWRRYRRAHALGSLAGV